MTTGRSSGPTDEAQEERIETPLDAKVRYVERDIDRQQAAEEACRRERMDVERALDTKLDTTNSKLDVMRGAQEQAGKLLWIVVAASLAGAVPSLVTAIKALIGTAVAGP